MQALLIIHLIQEVRQLLVDTNGLILHVLIHEANIQDYRGGKLLLAPLQGVFGRLKLIWADSGYKKEGFCVSIIPLLLRMSFAK